MLTLACGFIDTGSNQVVMLTRLPTFTRTPLPPLVATALPPATVIAIITETLPANNFAAPESPAVVDEPVITSQSATPTALATPPLLSANPPILTPLVTPPSLEMESNLAPDNLSAISTQTVISAETPINAPASVPTDIFTPTPTFSAPTPTTQTPELLDTPTLTPTVTTDIPSATATPILEAGGWAFIGVQSYPNPEEESVVLYGDVVNNTGSNQALVSITGTFYDGQGQVIADEENVFDYWPIETLPPSGRAPFELTVYDVQNIANFDLNVDAEASNDSPRQGFEILDLSQSSDVEEYCLSGTLRNQSDPVGYLIIIATLYDAQDNVISFGEYYKPTAKDIVGDQALDFEVCADTHNLAIADYEVYAWGQ